METRYVMLALLLAPMVFAEGPFFDIRGQGLDAAMDNVVCKTDFMTGVLESIMDHVDGTEGLQTHVDALEADVEELQSLADANDVRGFRMYLHESYVPDMKAAREAIVLERGEHEITPGTRAALKSDFDELHSEYESCNSESMERFANAKIDAYEKALELAENQASELSAKGVETSGLSSLIEEAQEEIVEPLQAEVDAADTGPEIRAALAKYCLFDGCPTGTNFNFAAKFGHEKLQSILDYVEDEADAAGLGDDVDEAQADLDEAKSILDSVGDGSYSESQGRELWNALHDAAAKIREIVSSLRSG
jgi:hypothetical protein